MAEIALNTTASQGAGLTAGPFRHGRRYGVCNYKFLFAFRAIGYARGPGRLVVLLVAYSRSGIKIAPQAGRRRLQESPSVCWVWILDLANSTIASERLPVKLLGFGHGETATNTPIRAYTK